MMVQPLVFIFDGMNDFRDLHQNCWDKQCSFLGVADAVAFQGDNLELREFPGQQSRYISLRCKAELPSPFKQIADQGDATGGMPQSPVQWGNQCGRSCYLLIRRNGKYFIICYNWPAFAFLIYIKCTLAVDEKQIQENNFSCFNINKHINHDVLWCQQKKQLWLSFQKRFRGILKK